MKRTTVFLFALILAGFPAGVALAEVTCASENTAVTATTPTADFSDNDDGTVTHNTTGLIWMRCSLGQTWDGTAACTGTTDTYTWINALAAVTTLNEGSGYADQTDWRLPNKNELASIVEERCWSPSINAAIFPDTPSAWFWSSSPYADLASYAWGVNFNGGGVSSNGKSNDSRVRLVRAGQ